MLLHVAERDEHGRMALNFSLPPQEGGEGAVLPASSINADQTGMMPVSWLGKFLKVLSEG